MKKIGLIDYYLDEYHAHEAFVSIRDLGGDKTGFSIVAAYAERDSLSGHFFSFSFFRFQL